LSLPITGSNFPSFASLVKSLLKLSRVGVFVYFFSFLIFSFFSRKESILSFVISFCFKILPATPSPSSIRPNKICSDPIYSEPNSFAFFWAYSKTLLTLGERDTSSVPVFFFFIYDKISDSSSFKSTSSSKRIFLIKSPFLRRARSKCSVFISSSPNSFAIFSDSKMTSSASPVN